MSPIDNVPLPSMGVGAAAPATVGSPVPARGQTLPDLQVPPAVIEQYKAKLTDLGNLGTRQSAMTT